MVRLTQEERVIDGKKSLELNTLLDFMTNFLGDKNIKLPGIKELSTQFFWLLLCLHWNTCGIHDMEVHKSSHTNGFNTEYYHIFGHCYLLSFKSQ
jgi:hypothetical protein